MSPGFLCLILHAHLPYVRHPQSRELAENWLYEAITETYIPLLNMLNGLREEGVDYRLTLSLSPTLISMLTDDLIQEKYRQHLSRLIELAAKEVKRTQSRPDINRLARHYLYLFREARYIFEEKYNNNLLEGFRELQEAGLLEIITTAATHGYLPLIYTEEGLRAQIDSGVRVYRRMFGNNPEGLWLPECGFTPKLDPLLAEYNLKYFISSTHGLLFAEPRPRYGIYAPVYTPGGVAAFGRDVESSKQVWSADEGYPGDYVYREFYRDIGHDLDYEYIAEYLPDNLRQQLGIKYYRITGKTENKQVYDLDQARARAAEHAGNFLFNRQHQLKYLSGIMDRQPILVAPYDAELFGHWWFEGPQWLEFLFKKIHYDQDQLQPCTPTNYLKRYPRNQIALPSEASWGYKGFHEVWLNGSNDWIYRHLHQGELTLIHQARLFADLKESEHPYYRTLNQMARELLLAQSSDWAFIMKSRTMVDYAVTRTRRHLKNFLNLGEGLKNREIDRELLTELEQTNNIFPELDFKIYTDKRQKYDLKRVKKEV